LSDAEAVEIIAIAKITAKVVPKRTVLVINTSPKYRKFKANFVSYENMTLCFESKKIKDLKKENND